jgi:hydroxymethylpyrimidine pyrophosphatase-like HAD family hydrolase
MIVFLTGAGGQGKTTTAKTFKNKKGWKVHLNKDHQIIDRLDKERKRYLDIETYLSYKEKAWLKFKKELNESLEKKSFIHIFDTCPYLYKSAIIRRASCLMTKHLEKNISNLILDIDNMINKLKKHNFIVFLFPYYRLDKIENDSYRSNDLMSHMALFRIIHSFLVEEKINFKIVKKMSIEETNFFIIKNLNKKMIVSDIDNTLIHSEYIKKSIKIPNEEKYISKENLNYIKLLLNKHIEFNLCTGRRIINYNHLYSIIPHNIAGIEHGSIVISNLKKINTNYEPKLYSFYKFLLKKDYKIDINGRFASFSVINPDNYFYSINFQNHGVKMILNENRVDVISLNQGKGNFIQSLKNNNLIYAIGNDLNDIEMLKKADKSFCLNDSHNEVKKIVIKKGGYVSPYSSHLGTKDILKKIYEEFKNI